LAAARQGDQKAVAEVFSIMYEDLRRLARSRLRCHQTMTLLDTTSLVNECFYKLVGAQSLPAEDRTHFFAYASKAMRSVIIDSARARHAERRGGLAEHLVLDTALVEKIAAPDIDVLKVHEALDALAQADARLAQVVEMRYFGGLSEVEIAQILGLSERTVRRDSNRARLLLQAAME
jgi:RNA polymerase sigma factor (TIGR02999 family)